MQIKILVLIAATAIFAQSCTRIDAANEGILVKQYGTDKGQGVSLVSGRVWYNPMTEDVFEYPVFVQTVDYEPFTVNSKDGSVFDVDPVVSYHIVRGKSPEIFRKYRKDIEEIQGGVLRNYVKDAFKNVFNNYTTDNILSQRQRFDNEVTELLRRELDKEGFYVEQLTFGLKYPETITAAVDAKNKSVQQALQARNELIKDSIDAQRVVIRARAEKEANELKQMSLTPLLVQQQFIEKWDGKTPLYGNAPVMFKNVQ